MHIQKVLLTLGLILLALVGLSPAELWAAPYTQTIIDSTDVYPWKGVGRSTGSPWNEWTDIIAPDPLNWDIKRVEVTWEDSTVTMEIFTNYPLTDGTGGTADVWLKNNANGQVAGILLHNATGVQNGVPFTAQLVTGITWESSRTTTVPHEWSNGGYYYGGEYAPQGTDPNPGETPLTYIANPIDELTVLATLTVSQNLNSNPSDSTYITQLAFDLDAGGYDWRDFDFTVMSGTCANEMLYGHADASHVPLPGSVLLLGSGLVGLGLISFRRRRAW